MDYSTGARDSGPVQFERQPESDPFDLEKRVNEVRGKKNALDAIGSRGQLSNSISLQPQRAESSLGQVVTSWVLKQGDSCQDFAQPLCGLSM